MGKISSYQEDSQEQLVYTSAEKPKAVWIRSRQVASKLLIPPVVVFYLSNRKRSIHGHGWPAQFWPFQTQPSLVCQYKTGAAKHHQVLFSYQLPTVLGVATLNLHWLLTQAKQKNYIYPLHLAFQVVKCFSSVCFSRVARRR